MTSGDLDIDLNENRPEYFRNDFRPAFERTSRFLATTSRSRVTGGVLNNPPPFIRSWKIQRPIRARVKPLSLASESDESGMSRLFWDLNLVLAGEGG